MLVLGDPFQLPPVQGSGFFTNAEPDVMLTEIHRQARDNPIIRLSLDIREGEYLERGIYGESRVIAREDVDRERGARGRPGPRRPQQDPRSSTTTACAS